MAKKKENAKKKKSLLNKLLNKKEEKPELVPEPKPEPESEPAPLPPVPAPAAKVAGEGVDFLFAVMDINRTYRNGDKVPMMLIEQWRSIGLDTVPLVGE